VYRASAAGPEYLLIGPSAEKPNEWLLPKGHIKEGETPDQAAIREVHEETGAIARVISPVDTVEFEAGEGTVRIEFYLMEFVSESEPIEKRRRTWFSYQEALRHATHPQTKQLLEAAETRRVLLEKTEPEAPSIT